MIVVRRFIGALACALLVAATFGRSGPVRAADCPGEGTVRMGLIPGEDTQTIISAYKPISEELSRRIGCPIELSITNSYSAAIEAMRAKRLDIATFGPLSYVLAHQVANAEPMVVQGRADGTPVTYEATVVAVKGSGITTLRGVAGHSFAYSDPVSTSGHLMPAYALRKAGIDPDTGVKPFFAGSHTASFEALRNHKVDAGELNTIVMRIGGLNGSYNPNDFVTLWRSGPLPASPMTIRGDLPANFKQRVRDSLLAIDLRTLDVPRGLFSGTRYVAVRDSSYALIRDLISTLHVDLNHIDE